MVGSQGGRVAFVTAAVARDVDEDLPLIAEAVARVGGTDRVDVVDWDDPTVDWAGYDAVVIRSTWDYTTRIAEFRAWIDGVDAVTLVANPAGLIGWNTDKRYLRELAALGVPTVAAVFSEAGEGYSLPDSVEVVVKPAVGAGSRDAGRYRRTDEAAIAAHVARLHRGGQVAMIQPYLGSVDTVGEAALFFFAGDYSHAITKGPLLRLGAEPTRALFAPERIGARSASPAELDTARAVLGALGEVPALRGTDLPPLYARVDLLLDDAGAPALLELEVCEPSLFLATATGAADRYVAAVFDLVGGVIAG